MKMKGALQIILSIAFVSFQTAQGNISASWSGTLNGPGEANRGDHVTFSCVLSLPLSSSTLFLSCPLSTGVCMENCSPVPGIDKIINCSVKDYEGTKRYEFSFTPTNKTFQGIWYCQQRDKQSDKMKLTISDKPRIESLTSLPTPIRSGSPVEITCRAYTSTSGFYSFSWWREGANRTRYPLPTPSQIALNISKLTIAQVRPGLDDVIACRVTNEKGDRDVKMISLNILYPPRKVTLTSSLRSRVVQEGKLVTLECAAEGGNPGPRLRLLRERLGQAASEVSSRGVTLSRLDNKAGFFCEASGPGITGGAIKSSIIVFEIHFPPEDLSISQIPPGQIKESQQKHFLCSVGNPGNPPALVKWNQITNKGLSFPIPLMTSAKNLDGAAPTTRRPSDGVLGFALESNATVMGRRSLNGNKYECVVHYQEMPVIRKHLSFDVSYSPNNIRLNSSPLDGVREGHELNLTCVVSACHPQATIHWLKLEAEKSSIDITKMAKEILTPTEYNGISTSSTLTLSQVDRSEQGTIYRCVVTHQALFTSVSKDIPINVFTPPVIRLLTNPHQVQEGQSLTIQCLPEGGNPSQNFTFTWFHRDLDSERTQMGLQGRQRIEGLYGDRLSINKTAYKDGGRYWCETNSPGGKGVGETKLNLYYAPRSPSPPPSPIISAPLHLPALISVRVDANPPHLSQIQWYRLRSPTGTSLDLPLNQPMDSSERISMVGRFREKRDDPLSPGFLIDRLEVNDLGIYECYVTHRLGLRKFRVKLTSSDISSIPSTSIRARSAGSRTLISFSPPPPSGYTHLVIRACPTLPPEAPCSDHQVSQPQKGEAGLSLERGADAFTFLLLVYRGSDLVYTSHTFHTSYMPEDNELHQDKSTRIVVAIAATGGLIAIILIILILGVVIYRWNTKVETRKSNMGLRVLSSNVSHSSSMRQRTDYTLVPDTESSFVGTSSPHHEIRSDNGSLRSYQQEALHAAMIRKKFMQVDDNGSMMSGTSSQPPDVVLGESHYIPATSRQASLVSQTGSQGSGQPTKTTLLISRTVTPSSSIPIGHNDQTERDQSEKGSVSRLSTGSGPIKMIQGAPPALHRPIPYRPSSQASHSIVSGSLSPTTPTNDYVFDGLPYVYYPHAPSPHQLPRGHPGIVYGPPLDPSYMQGGYYIYHQSQDPSARNRPPMPDNPRSAKPPTQSSSQQRPSSLKNSEKNQQYLVQNQSRNHPMQFRRPNELTPTNPSKAKPVQIPLEQLPSVNCDQEANQDSESGNSHPNSFSSSGNTTASASTTSENSPYKLPSNVPVELIKDCAQSTKAPISSVSTFVPVPKPPASLLMPQSPEDSQQNSSIEQSNPSEQQKPITSIEAVDFPPPPLLLPE